MEDPFGAPGVGSQIAGEHPMIAGLMCLPPVREVTLWDRARAHEGQPIGERCADILQIITDDGEARLHHGSLHGGNSPRQLAPLERDQGLDPRQLDPTTPIATALWLALQARAYASPGHAPRTTCVRSGEDKRRLQLARQQALHPGSAPVGRLPFPRPPSSQALRTSLDIRIQGRLVPATLH